MTRLDNGKQIYRSKSQFPKGPEKTFNVSTIGKHGDHHKGTVMTVPLSGAYSYFRCPKCLGVMQFNVLEFWEYEPDEETKKIKKSPCQHIVFEVWCMECQLGHRVKLSSGIGWQSGQHDLGLTEELKDITNGLRAL